MRREECTGVLWRAATLLWFLQAFKGKTQCFSSACLFTFSVFGARKLAFFFQPESFAKLNRSCWGWAFFCAGELIDFWVEWAELCMISSSSSCPGKLLLFALFRREQTAACISVWELSLPQLLISNLSVTTNLPKGAECKFFCLPFWCQFKECFNEDRWKILDHYFKTWQITDWVCFPAITANCIGTFECRG